MTKQNNWEEVINLADKYGFIHYCYGGVAILMTKENKEKSVKFQNKLCNKILHKFNRINRKELLFDEDLYEIDSIIQRAIERRGGV